MTAPVHFRALLNEPPIPEDDDTADSGQLPPYNAYSASGDVTAPLVYINFGLPADYEFLKQQNIDVKGKIVIARYGRAWRGVKLKLAQENGAAGCLLYSDPHEDGYFQNDVYPKGPMRPGRGAQRGSVLDITLYPGDPLSSGSKRLSRSEAPTLAKIPILPISYGDAKPLLDALGGQIAPEPWRGALPISYHLGPGPATVHLKLDFDWTNKPLRNVIVTIPGAVYKDQWILYGNHHDAWVNGASDPVSGASALLETARTLAVLHKQGWQPKRTIVMALWDGEEFGLTGSTEWVEKHQDELEHKAAAYLNSDSNGRGDFSANGSHTLAVFINQVLRDVPNPTGSGALVEPLHGRRPSAGDLHFGALGAGSDYVAFLDHAGVASLNLGFGSADSGVYHSGYDTLAWYRRFSDGQYVYGRALAQVMTTALLRLADAPVLPFEFHRLARTIREYLEEIDKTSAGSVDLREARLQLMRLNTLSRTYEDELALSMKHPAAPERLLKLNETLAHAESALLLPDGLPRREWYRHQIYAPGVYTGYSAKTLPGVREAAESQRWEEANQQAHRLSQVLKTMADRIEDALKLIKQSGG